MNETPSKNPKFIDNLEVLHNWDATDQLALKEQLNQIDTSEVEWSMADLETKDVSHEITNIIKKAIESYLHYFSLSRP